MPAWQRYRIVYLCAQDFFRPLGKRWGQRKGVTIRVPFVPDTFVPFVPPCEGLVPKHCWTTLRAVPSRSGTGRHKSFYKIVGAG